MVNFKRVKFMLKVRFSYRNKYNLSCYEEFTALIVSLEKEISKQNCIRNMEKNVETLISSED